MNLKHVYNWVIYIAHRGKIIAVLGFMILILAINIPPLFGIVLRGPTMITIIIILAFLFILGVTT